jgi:DNA repair exonuclease SbcCD ATPase subunit
MATGSFKPASSACSPAELAELVRAAAQRRQVVERQVGQAEQLGRRLADAEAEVARLGEQTELHQKVQALLTTIGEEAQETARTQVEGLVTQALQVVFGPELSFHLVPGERGGQATLDFMIRSAYAGAVVETPVLEARGGGMAAVVGFVLQLVVLLLTDGARRFLALDEPFAYVSESYAGAVAELLREVVDKAHVQVLLITHSPVYADYADVRIRLVLGPDGVTRVYEGETE